MVVRLLLTFLSAFLFFLSVPGKPVPLLAFVCLVPLGIALKGAGGRSGLILGFLYGFLTWLSSIWWLSNGLYLYVELPRVMAWFWTLVACSVSAVPYVAFGFVCGHFKWMESPWGPLRCAACLTVFLTWFPYPFPGHHAHSLYNFPLAIQILDLGGVPLLLFALNLANFLLAGALLHLIKRESSVLHLVAFVLVVGLMVGYGAYRLDKIRHEMEDAGKNRLIEIVSIQPNLPVRRAGVPFIFGDRKKISDLQTALDLSEEAVRRHPKILLVVWPELPEAMTCDPEKGIWPAVRAMAKQAKVPFLVNCIEYVPSKGGQYNNAQLILKTGEFGPRYRKQILFPFGEYLPLEKRFTWLRKLFPRVLCYIPGRDATLLPLGGKERIIPTICYEVLFPKLIREFVKKGGDIIVNMVDDAWFGQSDASAMHMALAVYRAVEFRVPLVRVTNSGNGVFVQPTGEIVPGSRTPVFQETITSFPLYAPEKRSPYFHLGEAFFWVLTVIFCFDTILLARTRSKRKKDRDC